MTLTDLYPPITLATVLNVVLFAFMWRAHQVERRQGDAPWYLTAGLLAYAVAVGAFVYSTKDRPLSGSLDYFGAAVAAQAMGAVIASGGLNALLFTRGRPWRERAMPVATAVFLLGLMLSITLKG